MNTRKLKDLKSGDLFKRKPDASKVYIRDHYNRKDQFNAASYTCTDYDDIGRCIFLNPNTIVYVDFDY